MIPFSPPRVDEATIAEVTEVLRSGWITTGPKTKQLEKEVAAYCGSSKAICLSAWTTAMELVLRWYGVGEGDEVIIPAYTYTATANIVMHCGAKPVMVDTNPDDFNISVEEIEKAITAKTKVIMPVDFAGLPCDYEAIRLLIEKHNDTFNPSHPNQQKLGRILLLADAAHSFGALYQNKSIGATADICGFSFHAVKNLTTAEGGALVFNLPEAFNVEEIYRTFNIKSLHGQTKDALSKTQGASWKYDVIEAGYKCNMTDMHAAIGLVEIGRYNETLKRRENICGQYADAFSETHFQNPILGNEEKTSSYHLYALRIKDITENQRDEIIQKIVEKQVSVNVHFQPLPLLSFYKNEGYNIADYPVAFDNYSREISLPVYYDLTDEQVGVVVDAVKTSVKEVLGL